MPTITLNNKSNQAQQFEVHGWNGNQTVTVEANSSKKLDAPAGSSGAIIALHDGQEGEQAEATMAGSGGNDFIDISNNVGAGGNMTVEQTGDASTRKGDPNFMQEFRDAYQKADAGTKAQISPFVHLNASGQVSRIDAIKDNKPLEDFVRSFADGKTYIGVGAVEGGSQGVQSDNDQSKAAHGDKDLTVTYSDGDTTAAPTQTAQPVATSPSESQNPTVQLQQMRPGQVLGTLGSAVGYAAPAAPGDAVSTAGPQQTAPAAAPMANTAVNPATPNVTSANAIAGEADTGGPGVMLTNSSNKAQTYYFYDNLWNGNAAAGANFDKPLKSVTIPAGQSGFVNLPESFKGRVQKGTEQPATWAEIQVKATDGKSWGDVSLEQGYDGAATVSAMDGSGTSTGFSNDILSGAPTAAKTTKGDGSAALASTEGNWMAGPNSAASDYENQVVGQKKAYIKGGSGTDMAQSSNNRLAVTFY